MLNTDIVHGPELSNKPQAFDWDDKPIFGAVALHGPGVDRLRQLTTPMTVLASVVRVLDGEGDRPERPHVPTFQLRSLLNQEAQATAKLEPTVTLKPGSRLSLYRLAELSRRLSEIENLSSEATVAASQKQPIQPPGSRLLRLLTGRSDFSAQ